MNAATFALRRAVNAYPDRAAAPLRDGGRRAARLALEQVAIGHGAGELLRAALRRAARRGGDALVGWPGWQPLPELVAAAGGRAVPVAGRAGGDRSSGPPPGRGRSCSTSPGDPTGVVLSRRALRDVCAGVPEGVTVVVDEALGEFAADGEDAAPLVAELPNLVVVRSFSKAHAMAGLRRAPRWGPRSGGAAGAERRDRRAGPGGRAVGGVATRARSSPHGGARCPRRCTSGWRARSRARRSPPPRAAVPFAWLSLVGGGRGGAGRAARGGARVFVGAGARLWGDERHVRRVAARGGGGGSAWRQPRCGASTPTPLSPRAGPPRC